MVRQSKDFAGQVGRIEELRGPLGPGGASVYRVKVQEKPRVSYSGGPAFGGQVISVIMVMAQDGLQGGAREQLRQQEPARLQLGKFLGFLTGSPERSRPDLDIPWDESATTLQSILSVKNLPSIWLT